MSMRISAIFLAVVFAAVGCARQPTQSRTQQALPVKTQPVAVQTVPDFTDYLATLRSRRAAVLQPQVEGYVTRILVSAGDRVTQGAPLIGIDPEKQQATLNSQEASGRAMQAQLAYNRTELDRTKQLYAAGVVSKQALDQAQSAYDNSAAAVDALDASVREQRVQLHYYTVNAPADGIIGDIPVRVGDRVKVDTALTTLDQGGELEAYISIPAEFAGRVRLGTPVDIIGGDGHPRRSRLTFVSPRVDTQNQLLLVKALVDNDHQRFRNEQLVHAHVIWSETPRPMIPVTAVSRLSGQTFAFVVETGEHGAVARQRNIRTGDIVGNSYVVLDGIKPGEKIITTGVQMLVDGMPVRPES